MEQKQRFVLLAESGHFTISELCEQFEISRKSGHKWIKRYQADGLKGLEDRSRAPRSSPARTGVKIERLIVGARRRRPTWGPKKIHQILKTKHDVESPPARSTIGEILKRNGLVKCRRRRPGVFEVDRDTLTPAERGNQVWAVDFKGWFLLRDGSRCDPLTISDLYSRYLVRVKAQPGQTLRPTQRSFEHAFRSHGLPEIIRVDNGAPFASMGPGGLSRLSVWWISLGIEVEFTRPGCPQDNGSHERMHRTMKRECCHPASPNRAAQQQRFDRWRRDFNEERPHEALNQQMPADLYQPSARRLDEGIKTRLYEPQEETLRVNAAGFISLNGKNCFVGEAFEGADVAIERQEKSGLVSVRYANVRLGHLENTPNARLRPSAYAERWEKRACARK
jgi:transposase InsO family protein